MNWINSAGGPLICADEDFVRGWLGVRGLSFRTEGVGSDYEVACKTTAFLEVLAKDGANALVLGDEPFQSSFFETHRGEFSIARWIFAESVSMEDVLPGCIGDLVEVAPPAVFAVNQGVMYLFDSGMPGRNAIESSVERTGGFKDCSKALLSPGVYSVTTERLELKKSYRFLVHRFVQA